MLHVDGGCWTVQLETVTSEMARYSSGRAAKDADEVGTFLGKTRTNVT